MSDTPETDDLARGNHVVPTEWAQQLERERDEAREKINRQANRIRYLEGATNHACGTPLSVALRERDEAREDLEFRRGLYKVQEEYFKTARRERDEARENLNEEMKFHHRTHSELIQTQCKLLDMEMKCDQLQDEIKRLKVILDLIKRDVS